MAKFSNLLGVAHNISHHTCSGLSYVSPHLAQALRAKGIETTQIDLLVENPYPSEAAELKALRMALAALHVTVETLLKKHGFRVGSVSSVTLHVTPAPWDKDGYTLHTRTVIVATNGQTYDSGWLK